MVGDEKFTFVLPTYNEADNISFVIWLIDETCCKHNLTYEVIVVDDNSPDGTQEVVRRLQAHFGNEKLLLKTRPQKLGLGSAYQFGLKYASGEFVFLMDADLSHHPKYIPQFIEEQRRTQSDIVTGTRYTGKGGVAGWSFKRKLTSRGANVLASTLLNAKVSDLTGAYRLYRKPCLEALLSQVASKGYAFQMEIIVRAQYKGYKISEVPIVFVDRLFGISKLGAAEFVMFLKGLLWLLFTL